MLNLKESSNSKIDSIDKIIDGMEELLSNWDEYLDNEYPFDLNLEELLISVIKWRKSQLNKDK